MGMDYIYHGYTMAHDTLTGATAGEGCSPLGHMLQHVTCMHALLAHVSVMHGVAAHVFMCCGFLVNLSVFQFSYHRK